MAAAVKPLDVTAVAANSCNPDDQMKNSIVTTKKSPMAAINDMARKIKIKPIYELLSATGQAHCRNYTVRLRLADEQWVSDATSIRKAQHLCAIQALHSSKNNFLDKNMKIENGINLPSLIIIKNKNETNIVTPTPSTQESLLEEEVNRIVTNPNDVVENKKINLSHAKENEDPQDKPIIQDLRKLKLTNERALTDTVKLNSLAAQYGWTVNYKQISKSKKSDCDSVFNPNSSTPSFSSITSGSMHSKVEFRVEVSITSTSMAPSTKTFTGTSKTLQSAKHAAANTALNHLSTLSTAELINFLPFVEKKDSDNYVPEPLTTPSGQMKNPIQVVHEMALRRKMPVQFETVDLFVEKGTSKKYKITIKVGPSVGHPIPKELEKKVDVSQQQLVDRFFTATAEGYNKRKTKEAIAKQVLEDMLQDLIPLDKKLYNDDLKTQRFLKKTRRKKEKDERKSQIQQSTFDNLSVSLTKLVLKSGDQSKSLTLNKHIPGKLKSIETNGKLTRKINNVQDSTQVNYIGMHPVSRLTQLAQLYKVNDPQYTVTKIDVLERKQIFHMQCRFVDVNEHEHVVEAKSGTKKEAKKLAAELMLKSINSDPISRNILDLKPAQSALKKNKKKGTKSVKIFQESESPPQIAEKIDQPESPKITTPISPVSEEVVVPETLNFSSYFAEFEAYCKTHNHNFNHQTYPRKTGDVLVILHVMLQGGKKITLHGLGKTNEDAIELAATKALNELKK